MKILLIETAAADRPGSMHRYADMIEQALADEPSFEVSRTNLAPTSQELSRYPRRLRNVMHHVTIARRAGRVVRKEQADLFHLVDGSHGYVARWLPKGRGIVTLHDIIPYLQSQKRFPVPPPSRGAQWLIQTSLRSLRFATRLMADSEATQRDVLDFDRTLADRMHVVSLAIAPAMLPPDGMPLPDWEARRRHNRPYLLHLGNNGFYKNRAGAVRIFDRIRREVDCRLIMAGSPPDESLREIIRERSLTEHVEFVIDPTDAEICEFYRMACLLLFPSYYEGFGWPPLEAMAWECPVVSSHNGSLAEVVGNAALTTDVEEEATLASYGLQILKDRTIADRQVSAGITQVQRFSMTAFRRKLVDVYSSLG